MTARTTKAANQPLQWTGTAWRVLVNCKSVGAVPAIERRSVMGQEMPVSHVAEMIATFRGQKRLRALGGRHRHGRCGPFSL